MKNNKMIFLNIFEYVSACLGVVVHPNLIPHNAAPKAICILCSSTGTGLILPYFQRLVQPASTKDLRCEDTHLN